MASEIPDYDEDVILPNTPLSQYMHEFEAFENDAFNEKDEFPIKGTSFVSFDIKSKLCYSWQFIIECFKLYLSFIYNIFVPCFVPFEYSELKHILDVARNSKVLISEDLTVLLSYESEDESNGEFKLSYSSVFQQCFQLFAFVLICIISRSITISNIVANEDLLSLFTGKSYFLYTLLQVFLLIISVSLYVNIFIISALIVTNLMEFLLCKIFCHQLRKKLQTTGSIMVVMRKCIRLIQEAELIARGFTSASVPGIVERLELSTGLPITSPQRQYPELRKCVFMWTQEMFMLYKSSTQKLMENKRFGPVLDFSSQSLATLDLKEFGNLLKYNINFDADLQELLKLTDGLSVSSLKTIYLLLELQVSEFYKYLYLISSFLISDDSLFHCSKKISYFHSLNSFIKILQSKDIRVWKICCETHKYYRSIEAVTEAEDKTVALQKSNSSHFEIYMHNMSLHLKAALKRLTDLEELFEADKKGNQLNDESGAKKVHKVMKEIKSEIDVYQDYYIKCSNELQYIIHGKNHQPVIDSVPEDDHLEANYTPSKPVITNCDSDPIIEDEIFEAFVTKAAQEHEDFSVDFQAEKQKDNSQVASRLLHELKNVLIVKANEHQMREAKALAKNMHNLEMLPGMNSAEEIMNLLSKPSSSESELSAKEAFSDTSQSDLDASENAINSKEEEKSCTDSDTDEKGSDLPPKPNSFAASIAALALQRQKSLGISKEMCFSDSNDSDDEICEN